MQKRVLAALAGVVALGLAGTAQALTATDLGTITLGSQVGTTLTTSFITPSLQNLGTLQSSVYQNGSVYTYVMVVTPSANDVDHFDSAFKIKGFNGVAGWMYADAAAAGGPGDGSAFQINPLFGEQISGRLFWHTAWAESGSLGFDAHESIAFFYQSDRPPQVAYYNLETDQVATAAGWAAAPEPSVLVFMASGLLALGGFRRKKPVV